MSASTTSSAAAASSSDTSGQGQAAEGITLVALITAISTSLVIFGVQVLAFTLLRNKMARIYKPKTYLVPERERTEPPPRTPWGWLTSIFRFTDREVIKKCGLDAYFFLRYLQTLLVIFIPLALIILPILVPLNFIGGAGSDFIGADNTTTNATSNSTTAKSAISTTNVTGLDTLAWGNVRPTHTHRYWAHLLLAILVIIWVCAVFFFELRVYIKVRQDYLTSAEHRLRASATTVLVSAIPQKWLTHEALAGLYDVFPGGIRNIWINRNFDELLDKIHERETIFQKLEAAETQLIRDAKKAQMKQLKKDRKRAGSGAKTRQAKKEEEAQELARANAEAERLAQSGGVSAGDPHQVPHNVDDAIEEEENSAVGQDGVKEGKRSMGGAFKIPVLGGGLKAMGQGIQEVGKGIGFAGNTVVGGVQVLGKDFDNQLETTNGFMTFDRRRSDADEFDRYGRFIGSNTSTTAGGPFGSGVQGADPEKVSESPDLQQYGAAVTPPTSSEDPRASTQERGLPGNTVRRLTNLHGGDGAQDSNEGRNWWKFWLGPSGGFASPVPTGWEGDEFPLTHSSEETSRGLAEEKKGAWAKIKEVVPFLSPDLPPVEYPVAYNENYQEDAVPATWEKYLKRKDRPTHRLSRLGLPNFLPGLPLINKKVDTIYWCREELARLNLEIETDQKNPDRFPLMNSAFIQFNHQVAAHMASQSVAHHVPKHMAPRTVEISPNDVIWDNMSIKWWEAWARTGVVFSIVTAMIILWTIPVAWTATLANLSSLARKYTWLHWLQNIQPKILNGIAGVLPAIVLALLLFLVPVILGFLSLMQGVQTGTQKQGAVQTYYFAFLFVQVFLVVSISGGAFAALGNSVGDITSIPNLLAKNLPKAANYFFSYMILQSLSTSSGTLLQVQTLALWFILPKLFDNTAREKWKRNTTLPSVTWGSFFPVYANFACIALVYSVVAPIIIIFAIITFTLFWIANRYNMLYVSRFHLDTGGVLYPRAINQTFTGLYVMELCLIGLFFLVEDENGDQACVPQAIIMIVAAILTLLFQFLLNMSFSPLFEYLPITFEDEAVLRDEAFERAQARRLGLDNDDEATGFSQNDEAIELTPLHSESHGNTMSKLNPVNIVQGAGSWALHRGKTITKKTFGANTTQESTSEAPVLRKRRRHRDLEAQQKITDALYGGYNDEIEDLTPDERDMLVKHAFKHYALRARRPTVWIPRDDLGVSDDEIKRTRDYGGGNIWISNVGAALDGKQRVVYGRNPPDFSEVDLINL